jgi:hypothetical protein
MRLLFALLLCSASAQAQVFLFGAADQVKQPRWDDSMVPALAVKTGATAPTIGTFGPSGNLQCYLFQASSVDDQCWFTIQIPHGVIEGSPSDLRMHIHWTQTVAADPGDTNVVWGLEYSYASIAGTFQAPTTITITNGVSGTAWKHQISSFASITNENQGISGILVCRMFRKGTDAADKYKGDAAFLGCDLHFLKDGIGSVSETSK